MPGLISYIDFDSVDWFQYRPGSRWKILFENPKTGQRAILVQWDPRRSKPRRPNTPMERTLDSAAHRQRRRRLRQSHPSSVTAGRTPGGQAMSTYVLLAVSMIPAL